MQPITKALVATMVLTAWPAAAQQSAPPSRGQQEESAPIETAPEQAIERPPREPRRPSLQDLLNVVTRPPPVREPAPWVPPPPREPPEAMPEPVLDEPFYPPPSALRPISREPAAPVAQVPAPVQGPPTASPPPPRRQPIAPTLSNNPRRNPSVAPAPVAQQDVDRPAAPVTAPPQVELPAPSPSPLQTPSAAMREKLAAESRIPDAPTQAPAPIAAPGLRQQMTGTIWWFLLALAAVAAAAAGARFWRHRELVTQTRGMIALNPSLDLSQGSCSASGLALTGPRVKILSRIDMGGAAWLKS